MNIGGIMKKHFIGGILVGSIIAAVSIILMSPQNGLDIVEEIETDIEADAK